MSNKKIMLGARYTLDMGQPVTLIPKRVLTEGIECEYVMSSPGRKEIIQYNIWEMNGFDVSDEDVKLIIETNENPPPPNEKLKEAFKQYKTDMDMTNKDKLILDILTKGLKSITKVGEEQEKMLKDLRDNGYGDIHPFHRDEMKSGISYTHGYSVGHKCLAEQVIELLKMTEDEITSKIEDDKRIEEENKKYMEDLLKSFKDKNDE